MKQELTAYISDLTITNRVLFVAAAIAGGLQIVSMLGYLGNEQPWTLRIVSFSLLALVAILLETQVHQVRLEKDRDDKISKLIESEGANSRALETVSQKLDVLTKRKAPYHIEPSFIESELDALLASETASVWKFRGGSGRWQRSRVLPSLTRIKTRDVTYKMLILDPRNNALCSQYAKYRNTHRKNGATEQATAASVKNDLLACIISAAWHSARSRITPFLYLNQTYSPLRVDLSNAGAMMTVSDLSSPGLFCRPESWFYQSLDDELERSLDQSPKIDFQHNEMELHSADALTVEHTESILRNTHISTPRGLERLVPDSQLAGLDVAEITRLCIAV
ncbi:hypothetical protein [Pseudarthrobacter sulfonivorans]|uniref:hypothetical protein n=1 Tax=Pseudarthrobacter sulfonivorans TaxID=121292 RepID=UPI002102606F|nr:hypothetical protein [Pseudarthrobacter sulfonivorans]